MDFWTKNEDEAKLIRLDPMMISIGISLETNADSALVIHVFCKV
jgi:hypothetical protein